MTPDGRGWERPAGVAARRHASTRTGQSRWARPEFGDSPRSLVRPRQPGPFSAGARTCGAVHATTCHRRERAKAGLPGYSVLSARWGAGRIAGGPRWNIELCPYSDPPAGETPNLKRQARRVKAPRHGSVSFRARPRSRCFASGSCRHQLQLRQPPTSPHTTAPSRASHPRARRRQTPKPSCARCSTRSCATIPPSRPTASFRAPHSCW